MKERKRNTCGRRFCRMVLLVGLLLAAGCGSKQKEEAEPELQKDETMLVGLILSSTDDPANETLIVDFEELAEDIGAELMIRKPDVTYAEAQEARTMTGDFILYDVNPIEYQMLYVNELVEADADVIAVCANHPTRLEPVLTAAKDLGIQVCAIEQPVEETCYDAFAQVDEAAAVVRQLAEKD